MSAGPGADPACTSLRWAAALFVGLFSAGLRRVVLSPGSRSTPLLLAAQRQPDLELLPILDERSAGFFALGLARASRQPVALVCTSGSAPAHWLPAVIEAHASAVPLVLLSADRPSWLRPWGANQTVDQTRLFGAFVLEFHDPGPPEENADALKAVQALGRRAAAVSTGRRAGPVHINLPFPEPLVPRGDCGDQAGDAAEPPASVPAPCRRHRPAVPEGQAAKALLRGRGLIVCGPGAATDGIAGALWQAARELALPVLVDPLSGLRFGPGGGERIARYDGLLRNPAAADRLRPDWVVRFGAAPVSKTLTEWLRGVPSILSDPGGQWRDPTQDARLCSDADPGELLDWLAGGAGVQPCTAWRDRWAAAEDRVSRVADDHLDRAGWCEPQVIRTLIGTLPAGTGLFSGNSLPVRQLDTWSGTRGAPLAVHCNRGASGIDGNVSTLAGLNAGGQPTLGLIGDLALVHDLTGLLQAGWLSLPLIVINNGGGRIFDYLPQHGLPGFTALWRTPTDLDLTAAARLFRVPHRLARDAEGFAAALEEALAASVPGMIELRIDAELSRRVHLDFWRLVRREALVPS